MGTHSMVARITDIIESIERVRIIMGDVDLDTFETDWQKQWLVERGIEIISEASRHLTSDLKGRHPEIPWKHVAGIGNVLRHNYENISAPVMWKLVTNDLTPLYEVCLEEFSSLQSREPAIEILARSGVGTPPRDDDVIE